MKILITEKIAEKIVKRIKKRNINMKLGNAKIKKMYEDRANSLAAHLLRRSRGSDSFSKPKKLFQK